MMLNKIENIKTVIDYIENNLNEQLDLTTIASAIGYSLPLLISVNGVWLAISIAEILACIVSLLYIIKHKRRYHYI